MGGKPDRFGPTLKLFVLPHPHSQANKTIYKKQKESVEPAYINTQVHIYIYIYIYIYGYTLATSVFFQTSKSGIKIRCFIDMLQVHYVSRCTSLGLVTLMQAKPGLHCPIRVGAHNIIVLVLSDLTFPGFIVWCNIRCPCTKLKSPRYVILSCKQRSNMCCSRHMSFPVISDTFPQRIAHFPQNIAQHQGHLSSSPSRH